MSTPYKKLTDAEKQVTFHPSPVNHSGILPSGEGNYYDPNQVLRNSDVCQVPSPSKPVVLCSPSSLPNDPVDKHPTSLQPNNKDFSNVGPEGAVTNSEASGPLGVRNNPLSNATMFPPQVFFRGPYVHFTKQTDLGLLPDGNGVVGYFPVTTITRTVDFWTPYGDDTPNPSPNPDNNVLPLLEPDQEQAE